MYSKEALEAMTVVELRHIARENGVTLSAGISKQGIVDRLCEALPKEPAAPVRRAASIVTDDEDTPVLTPNAPYARTAASAHATHAPEAHTLPSAPPAGHPTVNRGNIPGTNKPVFSLEGVRAWHNPRTYQQTGGGITSQRAPQGAYGQQRMPQRTPPTVSRFGPDAYAGSEAAPEAGPELHSHSAFNADSHTGMLPGSHPRPRRESGAMPSATALPDLLASGDIIDAAGVLEMQSEGYGYLRTGNYLPGPNDVYVSPAQVRRFHLHTGDVILGKVRPRRENDTHGMLLYITEINGTDVQDAQTPAPFDTLTAVYPTKQMALSKKAPDNLTLRGVDLMCPIGFGQRALIIAPPRCGKTALLTAIAASIHAQYPEAHLLSLLLGERPEDITIARDTLPGDVIYAGFDEPMENHTRIAELTLARAMRLAEQKKDVVLLVDSLTALCRAHNDCAPQNVRILSGGLAAGALSRPKHLFGAARSLREGGSLTIIAIMLSDTGIPLDQAIAEEFRGTANMELYLNGAGQIDFERSLTRNADAMLTEDGRKAAALLRGKVREMGSPAFAGRLNALLQGTADNARLIRQLLQSGF